MKKRVHVILYGRVQNVFFRFSAKKQAIMNNVNGWVKNDKDGTVEIIAEGNEENIRIFLGWCSRGPLLASVEDKKVEWLDYKDEFTTFSIRY